MTGGTYTAKKQNSSYLWFYYSDDGKECGSTQIDQTINNDCSDTPSESNITQEQLQTAAMSRSKEPASFTWRNLIRHHQSYVNNTKKIKQSTDGVESILAVGMAQAQRKAHTLLKLTNDYHYNKFSKRNGGAILLKEQINT